MRKLITATMIFVLAGLPASYARGGMHGLGSHALMGPANPTVPPSLTPDARLIGSAPVPPHRPMFLLFQTPSSNRPPRTKPLIGSLETFAAVVERKPRPSHARCNTNFEFTGKPAAPHYFWERGCFKHGEWR